MTAPTWKRVTGEGLTTLRVPTTVARPRVGAAGQGGEFTRPRPQTLARRAQTRPGNPHGLTCEERSTAERQPRGHPSAPAPTTCPGTPCWEKARWVSDAAQEEIRRVLTAIDDDSLQTLSQDARDEDGGGPWDDDMLVHGGESRTANPTAQGFLYMEELDALQTEVNNDAGSFSQPL